jgi:thiol-disulfide isomerase/thioredoxin
MFTKVIFVILLFLVLFVPELRSQQDIAAERINKEQLEKLITQREGKVLLLNIWASWCVPCREEFPDLVKIYNKYKKQVDVVAVSADSPNDIQEKIIPFLKEKKTNFDVYVNDFKVKSDLIDYLEKEWNGALPATFIYDVSGNRKFFFQGKKNFKEFEQALKEVLK